MPPTRKRPGRRSQRYSRRGNRLRFCEQAAAARQYLPRKVTRVEPSLQAAVVHHGENLHGFWLSPKSIPIITRFRSPTGRRSWKRRRRPITTRTMNRGANGGVGATGGRAGTRSKLARSRTRTRPSPKSPRSRRTITSSAPTANWRERGKRPRAKASTGWPMSPRRRQSSRRSPPKPSWSHATSQRRRPSRGGRTSASRGPASAGKRGGPVSVTTSRLCPA